MQKCKGLRDWEFYEVFSMYFGRSRVLWFCDFS